MPDIYHEVTDHLSTNIEDPGEDRLPADTALLIIDLQKAFDDPIYSRRNNPDAEANTGRLLAAWRRTGRPVIHVQHLSREAESPYRPGQPGCDFKDDVRPQAGELVIQKSTNNAFIDTGLGPYLADKDIRTLVVAGVATNNSVEATVRMAGNLATRPISPPTRRRRRTKPTWPGGSGGPKRFRRSPWPTCTANTPR